MSQPLSHSEAHIPRWWPLLPLIQLFALASFARPSGIEWVIFATFIAITTLSSWRLFADHRTYSLNKVWWLFAIVFLGIIPSLQLAVHTMPWHTGDILPRTMLQANGVILLCLGVYEGVRIWAKQHFVPQPEGTPHPVAPVLINQFSQLAPAIMLSCGAALIIVCGYKGLFLRGHMETALWRHSTTFQLLFDKGLRGTMLWCSVAAIVLHRQHRLGRGTLWLVLIPGILFNFPLALPRYLTLTIFLSWALAAGWSLF